MQSASVIVPCYKRIDQTLKTLQLLLGSEGRESDFELEVIVADCTPDDSLEHAVKKTFGDKVIYTRPTRQGIATNKNQGARIASHDIIIFCDSDIEVSPDTILKTLAAMSNAPSAAMIGGSVLWRGGVHDGEIDRPEEGDRRLIVNDITYIEALYSRYVATYKKIFWEVGGYDEDVFNMRGEGSDLSTRYWRAGYPLVYDAATIVHHIFDAPDSAAIRVVHPEYAVAKDYFLLAYKYGMTEGEYLHFQKTITSYFHRFGQDSESVILKGLASHFDQIVQAKPFLDTFRKDDSSKYDFKFLEIFSQEEKIRECIKEAVVCTSL